MCDDCLAWVQQSFQLQELILKDFIHSNHYEVCHQRQQYTATFADSKTIAGRAVMSRATPRRALQAARAGAALRGPSAGRPLPFLAGGRTTAEPVLATDPPPQPFKYQDKFDCAASAEALITTLFSSCHEKCGCTVRTEPSPPSFGDQETCEHAARVEAVLGQPQGSP